MKVRLAVLPLLLLAAALLASPPSARTEVVNRVVAVVGDDVVTSQDVERVVATMRASMGAQAPAENDTAKMAELKRVALEGLIEDRLFAQEVARQGLKVSDAEVNAYIEQIKRNNGISDEMFAAQLSRRGITPEEYKAELKNDMLKHKLVSREVQQQVVISDDQVDQYYREHQDALGKSDQVMLRALFLKLPEDGNPTAVAAIKQRAEQLRAEAVSKGDLEKLAAEHSEGPGAQMGGKLGPLATADLWPEMRQALMDLKPGEISPVVEMPGSVVFMELIERIGESKTPGDEMRKEIRAKMEQEALDQKFREWIKELRARTAVRIIE